MFKKIIFYSLLPMLLIALALSFAGVNKVELDNSYYNFFQNVSLRLSSWELTIPNIPMIPELQSTGSIGQSILIVLINFVNGISTLINVLLLVVNTFIHLLQFVLTLIYSCKDFIEGQSQLRNLGVI